MQIYANVFLIDVRGWNCTCSSQLIYILQGLMFWTVSIQAQEPVTVKNSSYQEVERWNMAWQWHVTLNPWAE